MNARWVSVIAALVVVGVLPGGANADTREIHDGTDEVPAQMDMRDVRIDNGRRKIVIVVRFRDLKDGRRSNVRVLVDPRPRDDVAFIAYAKRGAQGAERANLQLSTDEEFGGEPMVCPGYHAQWSVSRNRVRLVVPQHCLHHNGAIHRFKATSGFWDGLHGDWTRFVKIPRG